MGVIYKAEDTCLDRSVTSVGRLLKSSIHDQLVVRPDIHLPIDDQWRCEFHRTAQGVTRSILSCVVELGGRLRRIIHVQYARTFINRPENPAAIPVA